ncbi:efflux transporter periplasmic adaptor subunit [Thiocapsa imhoffii]|uniref:Efflux transporter periplasmic adaptor subunit n=1 Tax=Thiocapsa imhoffii TaxID=382777 RepID=A0A9X0WME4_9GAMM|nr:efflux RND transporter periplasmic adaptor subunit [Thiocapsa imhoffii]MBK1646890.1 efflux transporter periplasmic adaptor subunit [Thiocapsa imhoffii]
MHLTQVLASIAAVVALNLHAEAPVALDTAPAEFQTLAREYRLDGIVEAVNRTTVSAQTQGQVEAILFDVEDFVEKDMIVARLRDTEHRARVAQAAADLKSASARLEQTREEYNRILGLFEKRNVSESAMDQARADLESAQAALEASTARLEQAQEQLEYTQIRAPYSGIVTQRHIEVGEIASPGQQVMSGISLDQLRVVVDVPQSVIPPIRDGASARIHLGPEEVILSQRTTIFPFADLGSNTFTVRLDLPEGTKGLFPGMFVKTSFEVGSKEELMVPAVAVVTRSEVTGIYVVDEDGTIRFRQIRVGRGVDGKLVVLAGLSEGETVALDPIAAGALLRARLNATDQAMGADNG